MGRTFNLCILLLAFVSVNTYAQAKWIPDVLLGNAPATTLYSLSADGKPLILAVGNIHSQASGRFFEMDLLQNLVRESGAIPYNEGRDMHVAFLNVRVFPDEPFMNAYQGVPVFNIDEGDKTLSLPVWNELYTIAGTGLYLITPDHLVFRLDATSKDAVYAAINLTGNKLKPVSSPDARLLDVYTDDQAKLVHVSVQNFSKNPLHQVQVYISKNGTLIASENYSGAIAPLGAAVIDVPLKEGAPSGNVEVVAKVAGDVNPLNNIWTGRIEPVNNQPSIAVEISSMRPGK